MDQKQEQPKRPALSDNQACQMHFGGYLGWLRDNGIPTPTIAELRMMLYSTLYMEFTKQVRDSQDKALEELRYKLPQVQQALKAQENKKTPSSPTDPASVVSPSPESKE